MRRSDREITDHKKILNIIDRCDVCRLAMNDGEYPYIVPLNFGRAEEDGRLVFYFHSASVGKKLDLMRADPRVAFEMDCEHTLILDEEKNNCTMAYECVMGRGTVSPVPESEKPEALRILTAHYRKDFVIDMSPLPRTAVYRLTVESYTAKVRPKES